MMDFIQRVHVITAAPDRTRKHGGLQVVLPPLPKHRKGRSVRGKPGSVVVHRIERRHRCKNHPCLIKQDGIDICRKETARPDRHGRRHRRRRNKRIQGKAHDPLYRKQGVPFRALLIIKRGKTGNKYADEQKSRIQSECFPFPQRHFVNVISDHAPLRVLHIAIVEGADINIDIFSGVVGIGHMKGRLHSLQ